MDDASVVSRPTEESWPGGGSLGGVAVDGQLQGAKLARKFDIL
jgi:hypothetical protein